VPVELQELKEIAMDNMGVGRVGGADEPSNSSSSSSSEGNGFDSDSSSQINGVEQSDSEGAQAFGGGLQGLVGDVKSGDSLKSGNAIQEIAQRILEELGIKPPGEEDAGGSESAAPPSGGEAAGGGEPPEGASDGGQTPSLEDIIKLLAEMGLDKEQLQQITQAVSEGQGENPGQSTGTSAPSEAMFA
jgi:hypothetical protein